MNRISPDRWAVFVLLTAATLAGDLYAKSLVFNDLGYPGAEMTPFVRGTHQVFAHPPGRDGESNPYWDGWITFRLVTSFNRGALWGVGQQYTWLFAAMSLAAVIGIPTWLFAFRAACSLWLTVALGFILGGTLGNLFDRVGLHRCVDGAGVPIRAVRDFLLFTFGTFHWPVFNFADICLVTGAAMLVLHSFAPDRSRATADCERANIAKTASTTDAADALAAGTSPRSHGF